jgi:hypothetical protein
VADRASQTGDFIEEEFKGNLAGGVIGGVAAKVAKKSGVFKATKDFIERKGNAAAKFAKRQDIRFRRAFSLGPQRAKFRDEVDLDEFRRLNRNDADIGKLRPGEASAGVELQGLLGGKLRRAEPGDGKADFVFIDGGFEGKKVDFMFTVDSSKRRRGMNENFDKNIGGLRKQ